MPDITMCANPNACPKAGECWRATATPTPHRQSYSTFYREGDECKYFWSDRPQPGYSQPTEDTP